jgi:hypothetical protein
MIRTHGYRGPGMRLNRLTAWAALAALTAWLSASAARGAALTDLLNGGYLVANNCRFDQWQLVSLDDTLAPSPNLALVTVLPLVNDASHPGVQLVAGGELAAAGVNSLDLVFKFRVQALAGASSFTGQSLSLSGVTFGGNGGVAYVSQETTDTAGGDLGSAVVNADNEADVFQFSDDATFAPRLTLDVTVNVFLSGLAGGDSINLGTFTQQFAQTGPTAIAGDFNQDQRVDGADFLVWQRGQSPTPQSNQDLAAWRNNFGQSIALASAAARAPEPATGAMALVATLLVGARLRRR